MKVDEYIACLTDQVVRDTAVLNGDPAYHLPNRQFYEERVAKYKAEILAWQSREEKNHDAKE